jgi:hypothetical protein
MSKAQRKRLRWAVRLVLALGVAASVAANILHANPHPISQTIAAWPPLALLLTIELVSRIPVHRRSLSTVRILATSAIAGIAGWISYWHMAATASRWGESGSSAYLLPLTVDGLIVVASVSLVELAGKIRTFDEPLTEAPTTQAARVVDGTAAALPTPVSPAPAGEPVPVPRPPMASAGQGRETRSTGRSGPQGRGPSRKSPLTGRGLMEETPQP